jgi:hypothetical protein
MKPETLVKLSVTLLSEAEQEFRYKANECLVKSYDPLLNRQTRDEYDKFIAKADAFLEVIDKLNKI